LSACHLSLSQSALSGPSGDTVQGAATGASNTVVGCISGRKQSSSLVSVSMAHVHTSTWVFTNLSGIHREQSYYRTRPLIRSLRPSTSYGTLIQETGAM
jgi:small ligand-binding sensory domain FIST